MLIGHSQNSGLGRALPLIERTRPPYWVALDPDPHDAQRAAQHTRLIMRRHHRFDFDAGAVRAAMGASPAAVAREFVADCQRQPWYPFAWAVMTPPAMAVPDSPPDLLAWAVQFQAACVTLFAAQGRECFVCNVPTGNSGYHVPGARYYMAQEYFWPGGHDDRLRYRQWFPHVLARQPDAKLLIGECGATALRAVPIPQTWGAPHGADVGWRGGYGVDGLGEAAFAAQLYDYSGQLASDPYVLAAAVFQVGGNPDWESFEVLDSGIVNTLENAVSRPVGGHTAHGGAAMAFGPEIINTHAAAFEQWWNSGGANNFAAFLVATGQMTATDAERRALVLDRLTSATKETEAFLHSLPFA